MDLQSEKGSLCFMFGRQGGGGGGGGGGIFDLFSAGP